jgi:ABC-2 type transport system permease protein
MTKYLALLERELKSYFVSPVAYVVIGLFLAFCGLFFYNIVTWFDRVSMQAMTQSQYYRQPPQPMNVNMMAIRPLLGNIAFIALIFIPGLTMRLLAEEKRQGTMELLFTSPINNWHLTLAKFSSAWILYGAMLALTFVYQGLLFIFGNPEFAPIVAGYLGLFLIGGSFIALGLMFSAFTENQIIAFVATLATNLILLALGWLSSFTSDTLSKFLDVISPLDHFEDFAKGVIDTQHVVYYLSLIGGALFITYVSLESSRWRGSR